MKKITVNILCSTGITLLVLAVFAMMFGARFLFVSSVFESFAANIVIHIGLLFMHKFESSYALLEYTLDIAYTIAVVLACGALFNWYSSTPVWVLVLMSIIIYLIGILLSTIQMHQSISEINELLQKRDDKFSPKEL